MAPGKSRDEHRGAAPSLCPWVGSCGWWYTGKASQSCCGTWLCTAVWVWVRSRASISNPRFLIHWVSSFTWHTLDCQKQSQILLLTLSHWTMLVIPSNSPRNECIISQMMARRQPALGAVGLLQCMGSGFHWESYSSGSCSSSLQIRESEEFVSDFSSDTKLCKHSCCR